MTNGISSSWEPENADWGLKIIGFVSDGDEISREDILGHPVLGASGRLSQLLQEQVVDEVHFAVSRGRLDEMGEVFFLCEELGVRTRVAVNFFAELRGPMSLENLGDFPLLTLSTTPTSETRLFVKRLIDLIVSFLVLMLFLVPGIVIAVLIKLTSKGPVIFRQKRAGLYGRRFTLYKFRTMVEGAEAQRDDLLDQNEMEGATFKLKNDPRVTWVGKILRKLSLDEMPQFFNVFKGDMSLVGPRPLPTYEADDLDRWQKRRLSMKPGITCTWQISGRNEITHEQWMEMDLAYIDSWSLSLDFGILLKTIPAVVFGKGAR
jgi:exopolysaccharide biosynthesis polyprenyl glycosylphosphotransferase